MLVKWKRGLYGLRPIVDFNIMQPPEQLSPAQRVIQKLHFDYFRRAFRIPIAGKITVKDLEEYYPNRHWSNEWKGN